MNKYIAIIAFVMVAISVLTSSCGDVDEANMRHIEAMRDTIFKTFPTVASITIRVEDAENLHVTLGDAHLYAASDNAKKKEANKIGRMALGIFGKKEPQKGNDFMAMLRRRIFGGGNMLQNGKLTITKNEHTEEEYPADGISVDINLDSLRQSKP